MSQQENTLGEEFQFKKRESDQLRNEARNNPDKFWGNVASHLTWTKPWDKVCDLSDAPITRWFSGGELNMCYNCVDRHVENGYGDTEILTYESPVTDTRKTYTYNEIYDKVTHLAGAMREYEVEKGDRILIYMPMIAEGVFAMLASCRLGAIHCALPSGLPAQDLASKIDHFSPKVILTATRGYHANGWVNYKSIIDEACNMARNKPNKILVLNHKEKFQGNMMNGRDDDWETKVKPVEPFHGYVSVEANEALFVVYTSGSTGRPKGVVHSTGGYAVKLITDSYVITDQEKEAFYMTTNLGWIASHSLLIYKPLLMKFRTVIYEGDHLLTSDVTALYKLIETNSVTRLIIRPGVLKILKSMDPDGKVASRFNLNSIQQVQYGGERLDKSTAEWTADIFNTSIWNCYGQTELSCLASVGLNTVPRKRVRRVFKTSFPLPGMEIVIMKTDLSNAKPYEKGRILLKLPLPPGALISLLDEHEKCKNDYFHEFEGYFDTKDEGYLDENGGLYVDGRVDCLMKHGSIYLAAQAVEEAVMSHPEVSECVVISTPNLILKEVPVTLFMVKKGNNERHEIISEEILKLLSKQFGEAVTFGKIIPVKELPRTPTGKINRPSITALTKGLNMSSGVENPEVLAAVGNALYEAGYVKFSE